ncbi:UPF0481 protein At3g47200-like [Papaver somniferum]|uniref:UPF0481 protein At3g47200-like n=1 Tax=Papaver somniferum TaxID=3469 RepID=UPI000E6F8581|nr:UPF0481 protein At3g47200-like [Papaver somniferum]XP_026404155.1 UPF0481 protein At3g47200-like [Papaver somniferum]
MESSPVQEKSIPDEKPHVSISMQELIASSIKEKLETSAPRSRKKGGCSIHRVPEKFHKMIEPSVYKPEAISIGPYHCKNDSLQATQDLKLLYAHNLLTKTANQKFKKEEETTHTIKLDSSGKLVTAEGWSIILEECISSIEKMETIIRERYSEPIDLDRGREFVEMMVIDGLFIIGFLAGPCQDKYIFDDLLYCNDWLSIAVRHDLLLLENQIPWFVLKCLFNIILDAVLIDQPDPEGTSLEMLVIQFFKSSSFLYMLPTEKDLLKTHPDQCENAEHLLDFLFILHQNGKKDPAISSPSSWKILKILLKLKDNKVVKSTEPVYSSMKLFIQTLITKLQLLCRKFVRVFSVGPIDENKDSYSYNSRRMEFIPSATELSRAGVKFKKGSTKGSFLDVNFRREEGILEIPPIYLCDGTETLFRNLIACEQLYKGSHVMSSYATLMDCLINSPDDVKVLRKQEIITSYLGCDEDVADIFNKLSVEICNDNNYYAPYTIGINKYYKKRRHIWKAALKREYFSNPWTIVSVLAAVLLIALTITSTVFGILSFLVPKS